MLYPFSRVALADMLWLQSIIDATTGTTSINFCCCYLLSHLLKPLSHSCQFRCLHAYRHDLLLSMIWISFWSNGKDFFISSELLSVSL